VRSDDLEPLSRGERTVLSDLRIPACLLASPPPGADADGFCRMTLEIDAGRIARLSRADPAAPVGAGVAAMGGRIAFPAFVDMHTHLDKGHIWPRRSNPDGTFFGALNAVALDREMHWSADDLAARMDFALRCAHAHGTRAVRTHLDSVGRQIEISWAVFAEMRERWAGRVELQAVALFAIEHALDPAHVSRIRRVLVEYGGILGGVTYMTPELDPGLDVLFRLASEEGLDLDFHVDETLDPDSRSLRQIAEAALRYRFSGQITVGHCCSLARQPEAEAQDTIDRVAEAGIAVVSLPMCNLYLQDRVPGRTPRSRGITLLHELAAAGVPVCCASDNTRDPFYAYGDLDALEVYREATRIAHLDHPMGHWPRIVTETPARIMGVASALLAEGSAADLVLFRARSLTELLARPQADRLVLRAGRPIDTTLPDYAELDPLVGLPPPPAEARP
jgi:cytosine deaminase